jgi:hypothetical protein
MILKEPEASIRQWLMKRIMEPLKVLSSVVVWINGTSNGGSLVPFVTRLCFVLAS